jgi:hypothetical protein
MKISDFGWLCIAIILISILRPEACSSTVARNKKDIRIKELEVELARITAADSLIVIKGDTFKLCEQ